MIPVGYMAKQVASRPAWLNAPKVEDIYSVSNCVSADFMNYIAHWRHNGYWLFDHPRVIQELAEENQIDLDRMTFFYYEAYEEEFDEEAELWQRFEPADFPTAVVQPTQKILQGYDVVAFETGTNPGCSPLSCNHLASEIRTNSHCLLDSFDDARRALETGNFNNTEPGPYRIFAVYTIGSVR